jgi:tRNA(Ile)-lysidine synthase
VIGKAPLPERVAARLWAPARAERGDRLVVALSGGLDSVVLLHMLRFAPELGGPELVAAHLDHRMRPDSGEDARWVAELAHAWGVPIELGAAGAPAAPSSEAEARDARYAFLEEVRARVSARWILTAHHADDQAETVLFRIARGTGVAGLRGIPVRRGALLRPLLSVWREELTEYAVAHDLAYRVDPTNTDPRFARNLIRHRIVPALVDVAPGARRSLVRLARVAAREERAWRALLPGLLEAALLERSPERVVLARDALAGWPEALQARVLRRCTRELGGALDEAGTRSLIAFTKSGASGRVQPLSGGVVVAREFDRIVLERSGPRATEQPLEIAAADTGQGVVEIGGRHWTARWSRRRFSDAADSAGLVTAVFAVARLAFPLCLRGWRPGDRIRLRYGSKKLKKLLGESRIPRSDREVLPVLVDARGRVLWVPGVARDAATEPAPGEEFLQIGVRDGDRP